MKPFLLILVLLLLNGCSTLTNPPYLTVVPDGQDGWRLKKTDERPSPSYKRGRGTIVIEGKAYRYRYREVE